MIRVCFPELLQLTLILTGGRAPPMETDVVSLSKNSFALGIKHSLVKLSILL